MVHGQFSWSMFSLHLARGPKALRMHFLKKLDHESITMKCDHGEMPSDMVHDANGPRGEDLGP